MVAELGVLTKFHSYVVLALPYRNDGAEVASSQAAAAAVQVDTSGIPPASPNVAGNDLGGGASSTDAMSISQMMVYLI